MTEELEKIAPTGLTLKEDGRPPEVEPWAPVTVKELTPDLVLREMSRIAFDSKTPLSHRVTLLDKLAKIAGMYVERTETHHVDHTKRAIAMEAFRTMTLEERRKWLDEHSSEVPVAAFERMAPPADAIDVPAEVVEEREAVERLSAEPPKTRTPAPDLPDFFTRGPES